MWLDSLPVIFSLPLSWPSTNLSSATLLEPKHAHSPTPHCRRCIGRRPFRDRGNRSREFRTEPLSNSFAIYRIPARESIRIRRLPSEGTVVLVQFVRILCLS